MSSYSVGKYSSNLDYSRTKATLRIYHRRFGSTHWLALNRLEMSFCKSDICCGLSPPRIDRSFGFDCILTDTFCNLMNRLYRLGFDWFHSLSLLLRFGLFETYCWLLKLNGQFYIVDIIFIDLKEINRSVIRFRLKRLLSSKWQWNNWKNSFFLLLIIRKRVNYLLKSRS